jgi:hypothetical protein
MIIKITYRKFDDNGPVEFEQVDHTDADNLEDAMRQLERYAQRQLNRGGSWPVKVVEVQS